jgi:hypothetical protein
LTNLSIPKNKTHFDPKLNFDFLAREKFLKIILKQLESFQGVVCIFLAIQFAISIKLFDFYSGSKKI